MTSRPLVSVFNAENATQVAEGQHVPLPGVFKAPIRQDVLSFVHANLSKNRRQAHGVDRRAGQKHAAESWGTGRAVARIPRVSGSGTHRAGQAAFGNMCRKGRMFAPLKTWRRWHRKVNVKQRRHAVASALAASALTPLVLARGHRVANVPELPLVVEDRVENYEKTKTAVQFLQRFGAYEDVQKVIDSKALRAGKGKLRGKRYKQRKGPLVVYANEKCNLIRALRNVPGVETCNVYRLNLLQLAPGGQLGRFIVWTRSAFKALDSIFGSYRKTGNEKSGFQLQRPVMNNADLTRIINSNEVQQALNPLKESKYIHDKLRKNPLKNRKQMFRLNPDAKVVLAETKRVQAANTKNRKELAKKSRKIQKANKANSKKWFKNVTQQLEDQFNRDKQNEARVKANLAGELDEEAEE